MSSKMISVKVTKRYFASKPAQVGKSFNSRGMKRFWRDVQVGPSFQSSQFHKSDKSSENYQMGYSVLLDGRPVKTPEGSQMEVRSRPLADLIREEWAGVEGVIKPTDLQLSSLVSRAIDGLSDSEERQSVLSMLSKYLDTDTLCYHAESPDTLVRLQGEVWMPIVEKIEGRFNVKIQTTTGLLAIQQSQTVQQTLRSHVDTFDNLKLAGFEKAVMQAKSYLIGLALMERLIDAREASEAASLESIAQIKLWGEVEGSHDVYQAHLQMHLGSAALMLL